MPLCTTLCMFWGKWVIFQTLNAFKQYWFSIEKRPLFWIMCTIIYGPESSYTLFLKHSISSQAACYCFAILPRCGGEGGGGNKRAANWEMHWKKILGTIHSLLTAAYENLHSGELFLPSFLPTASPTTYCTNQINLFTITITVCFCTNSNWLTVHATWGILSCLVKIWL